MRTLHDALRASNIPQDAEMVGGYVDGEAWSQADWDRFPNAVKVRISAVGTNDGHVLDVERGNLTAEQTPQWLRMRRMQGVDPTVYCGHGHPGSGYDQQDIIAACNAHQVALPHWWLSDATGEEHHIEGTVATQWAVDSQLHTGYDLSLVVDHWPGIDKPEEEVGTRHIVTAYQGAQWIVDANLTSRVGIPDEQDLNALLSTGNYVAEQLDDALMGQIPIVRAVGPS